MTSRPLRLDFVIGVATWAFIGPDGHGTPATGVQPLWALLASKGFHL